MTETSAPPRTLVTEASVYGVILVSGMIVVTGEKNDASWDVFITVVATVLVFWAAHVYAGVVAHLGEWRDAGYGFGQAIAASVRHSGGLLLAALIPSVLLLLGAAGVLRDNDAIWGALIADTVVLAVLGYIGVARWSPRVGYRLLGSFITAGFGVLVVLLKAFIH